MKTRVLGLFIAVLAFGALAVSSASATLWLFNSLSINTGENRAAAMHGTIIIHHEAGIAGPILVECSVLFIGTVGAAGADEVTEVQGLAGEKNLINCKTISGSCPANVVVHVGKLPWLTQLLLISGVTHDDFLGKPTWQLLCTVSVTCEEEAGDFLTFTKNGVNGAEFEDTKEGTKEVCSDGGTAFLLGFVWVLNVTVS